MNIYFLVEGRRTEKVIYPKWLQQLSPKLKQVKDPFLVKKNNYFLFNGNGFPSLLHNHLTNTFSDINEIKKYHYLVLVLDSDECTVSERAAEVESFIQKQKLILSSPCKLRLVIQNRCIETWLLGNKKVVKTNPQSKELVKYIRFFNVKEKDPEKMGVYTNFSTHAQFHESYLSELLRERNIRYTKRNPNGVTDPQYLNQLLARHTKDNHLETFGSFLTFIEEINSEI